MIMAFLWIGSFYMYGIGTSRIGQLGSIIGWPIFITLSIIVGTFWGIWNGEWDRVDSNDPVRKKLKRGLAILIIATIIIGLANFFQ